LLYTGITRAKTKVIIVGDINIIKNALNLSVKRNSGLSMCLEKEILNNEKSIRKRIF
jgi:ATP-dependent exoDNAse (exonuclease V) alpha subunit